MKNIIRKEFDFFTAEIIADKSHVSFEVYEGIGHIERFEEQVKLGIDPSLGPNYNSKPLVIGYIKWDGCSNWDFNQIHFCSQEEVVCFGKMLNEFYNISANLIDYNLINSSSS